MSSKERTQETKPVKKTVTDWRSAGARKVYILYNAATKKVSDLRFAYMRENDSHLSTVYADEGAQAMKRDARYMWTGGNAERKILTEESKCTTYLAWVYETGRALGSFGNLGQLSAAYYADRASKTKGTGKAPKAEILSSTSGETAPEVLPKDGTRVTLRPFCHALAMLVVTADEAVDTCPGSDKAIKAIIDHLVKDGQVAIRKATSM